MSSAQQQCGITRDVARAAACGLCPALAAGRAVPPACAGVPPAACGVAPAANARMALFASRLSPANLWEGAGARAARRGAEAGAEYTVAAAEGALQKAYGVPPAAAAAATSWPAVERCLAAGLHPGGGAAAAPYLGRADAVAMGMAPAYPLGGRAALGALWRPPRASPLPLSVDYLANPDLFTLALLALLAAALAAAALAGRRGGWRAGAGRGAAAPALPPPARSEPGAAAF